LRLFPHCAAVVHHGGVGTVAKALATGTPQLILPRAFDQMDNAARVKRLGAGDWLKSKQLTGTRIAIALGKLMTAQARERCRAVAGRFRNDDAFEIAAVWIEELTDRARPRGMAAVSELRPFSQEMDKRRPRP
jgi:UDP:flavonoid glycosyltransferase YjiC (YdhE family)